MLPGFGLFAESLWQITFIDPIEVPGVTSAPLIRKIVASAFSLLLL